MIAIIAEFKLVEGKGPKLEEAMKGLAAQVRKNEPGNSLYTLCKKADGKYIMLELYESEEALSAHTKTDHFKAAGAQFAGVMAEAPKITKMEVIC